jgi:ribosome-binding factor A
MQWGETIAGGEMPVRRIERLNEQLKREITDIVRNNARDPRIGVVTVTRVQSAQDLSFARVFVSLIGDDEEKKQSLEGLAAAAPFIRSELSKRLSIRRVPELRFELDRSVEHALKIEKLLGEVRESEQGSADDNVERDAIE